MRTTIFLVCLAALGCAEATPPAGPAAMTGTWRQSGDLEDQVTGDSHIHLGTFELVASDPGTFSGTGQQSGVCSSGGNDYQGPLTDGAVFPVTNGSVRGDSVFFTTPICEFSGTFETAAHRRMTGFASCNFQWQGQDYQFEGQWQADH